MEKNDTSQISKVQICDILGAQFFHEGGWRPNYAITQDQRKLFRVNVVGVLLDKEVQGNITSIMVDDGSGKITVRCFEELKNLDNSQIGNALLVIGRVREYNGEKYISPEILKPVDNKWLRVRMLELKSKQTIRKNTYEQKTAPTTQSEASDEQIPSIKLLKIIEELDPGGGVPIDTVIEKSSLNNTEELIQKMIESGELFQNQPGKIKVL